MTSDTVAWDAHAHVIGDQARFPMWPGRSHTPEPASLEAYLAMLDQYGLAHGVLVQPSVYGSDNRCLIDALDRAAGRLFGVIVPAPDVSPRDLEQMHRHGVRGVRCNLINPGGLRPETVIQWRWVLRALGWHVQLHIAIADLPDLAGLLPRFGVPVVVDHFGRPAPGHCDPDWAPLRTMISLVRDERCYVKLSAPYRLSSQSSPWPDVTPLAAAFVRANPGMCLWGSDWPHVGTVTPVSTSDVMDGLNTWCPDPELRRIVTSRAAQSLFGGT